MGSESPAPGAAPAPSLGAATGSELDSSSEPTPQGCEAGARDCLAGATIQCVDGAWITEEECQDPKPYCSAGRCIECLRGQVNCDGATVLRCDEAGTWQPALTCSATLPICLEGKCVECRPGRNLCNGRKPVECLGDGTYTTRISCSNGTRCVFGDCVTDQPPTVTILEPADGAFFRLPENYTSLEIVARGKVTDAEDVGIEGPRLLWSTDRIDLQENASYLTYGSDTRLSLHVPKPCAQTKHQLKLSAEDSAFNHGEAVITVTLGCYNGP